MIFVSVHPASRTVLIRQRYSATTGLKISFLTRPCLTRCINLEKGRGAIHAVCALLSWCRTCTDRLMWPPPSWQNVQFRLSLLTSLLSILVCLCALELLTTITRAAFLKKLVVVLPANSLFSWVCCEVFVTLLGQVRVKYIVHTWMFFGVTVDLLAWMDVATTSGSMWEAILCVLISTLYIYV